MSSQHVVFRPARTHKPPDLRRPRPLPILGWLGLLILESRAGWALVIGAVVAWWLMPMLVWPAALTVVVIGAWIGRRRHTGELPRIGWLNGLRTFTLSAFAALTTVMWAVVGGRMWARLGVLVCLLIIEALLWQPRSIEVADWWRANPLRDLLIAAGVIPKPADGEPLPKLRYLSPPSVGPLGVELRVELPAGVPNTAAVTAATKITSRIPGGRHDSVIIEPDDYSARAVRIWAGAPGARVGTRTLTDLTARQDARTPAVLARDRRNADVELSLDGRHTLVIGATGSGKTTAVRELLRSAVLDPTATIVPLVFKDDPEDWRDGLDLICGDVAVYGLSAESVRKAERVLEWLTKENDERGALRLRKTAGPLFVLIEEWGAGRIRMEKLDPALAARCDGMVTELLMTMRSRGMSAVLLSQRGTVTYVPGDQKINALQRFVGRVPERRDAASILDTTANALPALPAEPGEFLHVDANARTPRLIRFDHMGDDAWLRTCQAGAQLRAGQTRPTLDRTPATTPATPAPVELAKHDTDEEGLDELEVAVSVVLGQDGPLLAGQLLDALADFDLPAGRVPADARALGVELARLEARQLVTRATVGKSKGWALRTPAGTPAGYPENPRARRPAPPQRTLAGTPAASAHAHRVPRQPATPAA